MAYIRTCTECGDQLSTRNPNAKTCSEKCRAERSRRLKRQNEARKPPSKKPRAIFSDSFVESAQDMVEDQAKEVIRKELQPVVREALTEEVLRGIHDLVKLSPKVVKVLESHLDSPDPNEQYKAASLIAKYTIGNTAVNGAGEDEVKPMTLNINVPRPASVENLDDRETHTAEGEELRECENCKELKTFDQFIGDTDRCKECHKKLQDLVIKKLSPADD